MEDYTPFKVGLETIVLEMQQREMAAKFEYDTLKNAVKYYTHQLSIKKEKYETVRSINNYITTVYENAVVQHQQI